MAVKTGSRLAAFRWPPSGALRRPSVFDDIVDDNTDDSHYRHGPDCRASRAATSLIGTRACCWQCGGQGFESP